MAIEDVIVSGPLTSKSRGASGERKEATDQYLVQGTVDRAEAKAALAVAAPDSADGLARTTWDVTDIVLDENDPERSLWLGTVEYGILSGSAPEPLEVGDVVVTASTMGGTEHITYPIDWIGGYFSEYEEVLPTMHGIGDNGEGEVAGVDIAARAIEIEVTKVFASSAAAPTPVTLFALATCTNKEKFEVTDTKTGRKWTFEIGECLLLGHREGRGRVDGALEITYKFAGSPTRKQPFTIPNTGITITDDKPGWAYLWLLFEKGEDTAANRLYAKARAAFMVQVYHEGDFTGLNL